MKKKEYIQPIMEIVEIETCTIMNVSSPSSNSTIDVEVEPEASNNMFGDAKGREGSSFGDLW